MIHTFQFNLIFKVSFFLNLENFYYDDNPYPMFYLSFQRPSPDMKQVLYELLHELLINNWRFFFKGSVLTTLGSKEEIFENEPQFSAIMQVE